MLRRFFVYIHTRPDTGEVFYVGKGSWTQRKQYQRVYAKNRSVFWQRIVKKSGGFSAQVIASFETEAECFAKERELIAHYKRHKDGGTLCNLTLGGEGHLGLKRTPEQLLAMSLRVMGEKHPRFGKKSSAETCLKKSIAVRGDKHHLKGKSLPPQWVEHLSQSKLGRLNPMFGKTGKSHHNAKRIIDDKSGKVYYGVPMAAKVAGVTPSILYQYLDGHRKNKTTMRVF